MVISLFMVNHRTSVVVVVVRKAAGTKFLKVALPDGVLCRQPKTSGNSRADLSSKIKNIFLKNDRPV